MTTTPSRHALHTMEDKHIHHLPVRVRGSNRVVGILSLSDLALRGPQEIFSRCLQARLSKRVDGPDRHEPLDALRPSSGRGRPTGCGCGAAPRTSPRPASRPACRGPAAQPIIPRWRAAIRPLRDRIGDGPVSRDAGRHRRTDRQDHHPRDQGRTHRRPRQGGPRANGTRHAVRAARSGDPARGGARHAGRTAQGDQPAPLGARGPSSATASGAPISGRTSLRRRAASTGPTTSARR